MAESARDDSKYGVYQGARVKVHDLQHGDSLKYNNTFGTVLKYWPESGRWDVLLDLDDTHRGLKPQNLTLAEKDEEVKEDEIYADYDETGSPRERDGKKKFDSIVGKTPQLLFPDSMTLLKHHLEKSQEQASENMT